MAEREKLTVDQFNERFGRMPEQDDLDRVNCPYVGQPMHTLCGLCPTHGNRPRFECGCATPTQGGKEP